MANGAFLTIGALVLLLALPAGAAAQPPSESPSEHGTKDNKKDSKDDKDAKPQRTSRISDDSVPELDVANYPARPRPILEVGPAFLGTGNIEGAFTTWTGAVWQPQLIAFGTYSTAIQATHDPVTNNWRAEWANRLDIYTNLQLSGTERLVVGFRPVDQGPVASGYDLSRGVTDRWRDGFNHTLGALFFEGDVGEIFPGLDPLDRGSLDIGFAVGRQPLAFQDGILINDDAIDAVGITRNNILPRGGSNIQITGLYGWGALHGNNNVARPRAQLAGAVIVAELGKTTYNGEAFYVNDRDSTGDGAYWAISATRRYGHLNTTFRALGSYRVGSALAVVPGAPPEVATGHLFFSEISTTPPWTHDLVYLTAFASVGDFTSVARAPGTGGPLGRVGILFAAPGYGRYPAPLSNRADEAYGGTLGYQKFMHGRRQIIFEVNGRGSRDDLQETATAAGTRFQQAVGRHLIFQLDAYGKYARRFGASAGFRTEMRVEF